MNGASVGGLRCLTLVLVVCGLGACRARPFPDPPPNTGLALGEIRERLGEVRGVTEQAGALHARDVEALQRALADAIASLQKSDEQQSRHYAEIIQRQQEHGDHQWAEGARLYRGLLEQMNALRDRNADLRVGQGDLRAQVGTLKMALDVLVKRVEKLETPAPPGTQEKSFWELYASAITGFAGVMIGGVSTWVLAWRNRNETRWQKRQETTIKLMQEYMSSDFYSRYAGALGAMAGGGQSSLGQAATRNQIRAVLNFFDYVMTLKRKQLVDDDLVRHADLERQAKDFVAEIDKVDVTTYPVFKSVQDDAHQVRGGWG